MHLNLKYEKILLFLIQTVQRCTIKKKYILDLCLMHKTLISVIRLLEIRTGPVLQVETSENFVFF